MKKNILCFLYGISFFITLTAQNALYFKEVNTNKIGLSTVHLDLLEDAHGNLWDGTLKGLYLFDGEKSILIKDSSNQINSQANILAAINDDSIMVGIDHGLGIATKKRLIPLDFSYGVWGLLQVAKNKVFIGSRNGLYLWENGKIKQIAGTEKMPTANLVMTTKDCIYFSTIGKIFRYNNNRVELVTNTAAVTSKLYVSKQNVLYFADTCLHKIINGNIVEVFHPKNTITSIKESANGNLLVCASSLYELGENFVHELFSLPVGKGERITKTMYDKTGRLWLMSNKHIFYQSEKIYDDINTIKGNIILYNGYSDSLYRILTEENGKRLLNINGIVKPLYDTGNEGQTKYATRTMFDFFFVSNKEFYLVDGRGYQYFNGKKVASIVFNPNYDLSYKIYFAEKRKQIWLHTLMGPALLNGDKYVLYNKIDYKDRAIENIAAILPDPNYNWIWFGSFTGDFGYVDADKNKYVLLDTIIGLRKNYKEKTRIFSVLSDKQNNLWVYAEHKGLYKIIRNGNDPKKYVCKLWDANASLGEYKFDINGNLWAILDEGVKVYQAGASGVPENPLLFKTIDPISDLDGIKTEDVTLAFDNQSNLPNQFTLYGNANHVYQFHLDKLFLSNKELSNPIVISNVLLHRNEVDWEVLGQKTNINGVPYFPELKYFQNDLGFQFGTISAAFGSVVYRTKLNGYDTSWVMIAKPYINYSSLNPGKYSFEIQYSFNGVDWSNSKVYPFEILPPWWATWWFRTIAIVLFFLMIVSVIRYRTINLRNANKHLEEMVVERTVVLDMINKDLEKANRQNRMLLSVMAHDIKSPLRFLSEVSDNLYKNWENINEEKRKAFGLEIKKSAKALSYFMNGFLLWIKSKWDKEQVNKEDVHVTALLKEVAVYHEESGNKGTNTIIIIADESLIAKTSKRYLEIIISNIVDNACKYTRNGTITLSAYAEENKIIISCRDTGRGMSAEKIDSLLFQSKLDEKEQPEAYEFDSFKLGYRFINDMVKLIGAGVSITSTINQGTEVKIILTGLS